MLNMCVGEREREEVKVEQTNYIQRTQKNSIIAHNTN